MLRSPTDGPAHQMIAGRKQAPQPFPSLLLGSRGLGCGCLPVLLIVLRQLGQGLVQKLLDLRALSAKGVERQPATVASHHRQTLDALLKLFKPGNHPVGITGLAESPQNQGQQRRMLMEYVYPEIVPS